ncbi:MAG: pilus assembly protein [Chloracidobacterium sp.]|nr:pilus assembly protein [Chloracidobacterium sp.]
MNKVARANCERGLSTVELTMALPLVIFAMLFLIGMGHALITKQHVLVGGEFAAQYQRVRKSVPPAASAGQAVSAPAAAETFRLSGGGSDTLSYTANSTPRKGLIARLYRLNAAQSQYQTPNITNACVPQCKPFDSFARILSPEMITGLIFSGNGGGLSSDDLLSAVAGKAKKNRKTKPDGAVATSPLQASAAGVPGALGIAPAAGGGGGGKPPRKPPAKAAGTGDDGNLSSNGGNGQNKSGGGLSDGSGGTNRTPHAQDRKTQADEGDTHRQVGDANRVRQKGRPFRDSETGNTIYVDGDRVVVVDPQGREVTRFKNTRANTQKRIQSGKWIPIGR